MTENIRRAFFAFLLWSISIASVVGQNTVKGPEVDTLVPAVTGYVLTDLSSREITAIELPSLKKTIIRPTRPRSPDDDATIHALSGPDADGRIAYIEDHFFVANDNDRRHALKTIQLDGTGDTELFSRPGDAMWATSAAGNGEIGEHLALSPVGGHVAFVSALKSVQMPGALLSEGVIEIWELEKKVGAKTDIHAMDDQLAWFPDGKRLAYAKLVAPSTTPKNKPAESFGKGFREWPKIPAVFIRDVETGNESFLHVGWSPVVSFDGEMVLVSDLVGEWKSIEVSTKKERPATWSGNYGGAIAMPAKDIVLSWCLPTKGMKVEYTDNNSPLVGPKLMLSLKLARMNSGEFQTVVPYIDPRDLVSIGQVKVAERKQ